jgi:CRP-like cAMP-binding protein
MNRRTARGQVIPPQEVEYLNSLEINALIPRVAALYAEGWSLQAIGDSLLPKRPRTTIRSWVVKGQTLSEQELIDAPIPTPTHKTPETGYQRKMVSPGISEEVAKEIKRLAPLARSFRSKMSKTSAAAVANQRLTDLCQKLHENGVGIREIAETAGVTYRAMYKRIKL